MKKRQHPLAKFRKVAGITQDQLAEGAATSVGTVRHIEGGRLALSEELANRIRDRYGVAPCSLLGGRQPMNDVYGRPLAEGFCRRWNAWFLATSRGENLADLRAGIGRMLDLAVEEVPEESGRAILEVMMKSLFAAGAHAEGLRYPFMCGAPE